MKYFKVPVRMDGKKVLREVRRGLYEPTRELIQNELYTEKEIIRFGMEYLKEKTRGGRYFATANLLVVWSAFCGVTNDGK